MRDLQSVAAALVREQAAALERRLRRLRIGETLCVHADGIAPAPRSSTPYRMTLSVELHVLSGEQICTRRTACTQYGPMTLELREKLGEIEPCPKSPDHRHCPHWYGDESPCCYCGAR